MGYFCVLGKDLERKLDNRRLIIRDKDSSYLIYERKYTESGLSRWVVLRSSGDFNLKDENITVLRESILSINIEGIKLSKDIAEIWLMHNGKMVRHYKENVKHIRLHWLKITYAGEFKRGDILSVGSTGLGDIQVTIMCLD